MLMIGPGSSFGSHVGRTRFFKVAGMLYPLDLSSHEG